MSENTFPITQDEMFKLFGEHMPIEAVKLLFESPDTMTCGELRNQLRQIAANKKLNVFRPIS